MFAKGDIVKFASFVGIIDKVYINPDDGRDVIYAIAWAKNAYQPKPTELVEHSDRLSPATVDELNHRVAQLREKYEGQVTALLDRLETVKA